jgi:hypothetical protein
MKLENITVNDCKDFLEIGISFCLTIPIEAGKCFCDPAISVEKLFESIRVVGR